MAPLIRITGRAHRGPAVAAAVLFVALALPALAWSQLPLPVADPTTPAKRDAEPVVLTGKDFLDWSARANATVKLPLTDLIGCNEAQNGGDRDSCAHNHYEPPEVDTAGTLGEGTPTEPAARLPLGCEARSGSCRSLPGRRGRSRAISTTRRPASPIYSGEDQHTTYAYDREGFRYTQTRPGQPVPGRADRRRADDDRTRSRASTPTTSSRSWPPTPGPQAPAGASRCRAGIDGVTDGDGRSTRRRASRSYVYVMQAPADGGPKPAFTAATATCTTSATPTPTRSSTRSRRYDDYGNAAKGVYCDADGNVVRDADGQPEIGQRRPRDYATITTAALPLPLRRPLADDAGCRSRPTAARPTAPTSSTAGRRARSRRTPAPKRRAAASRRRTPTGAARDAARRAGRPGARDPRDLGRRLRHERHPPRDLLPRRDAPEDLAARARDPAARRHLRAVGLQRGRDDAFFNPRERRQAGVASTGATTRCSATSTTRATRATTGNDTGAARRRPTARSTAVRLRALQRAVPYHQSDRPGRPDVRATPTRRSAGA